MQDKNEDFHFDGGWAVLETLDELIDWLGRMRDNIKEHIPSVSEFIVGFAKIHIHFFPF